MEIVPETGPADRYETFVVRLWVEEGRGVRHGEISHLPTGIKSRFQHVGQAIDFMGRFVEGENQTSRRENDAPPPPQTT